MKKHGEQKFYYYVLRRDYVNTSICELRALIETYDPCGFITQCFDSICIAKHRDDVSYRVMNRASFVKNSGYVIDFDNLLSPSFNFIEELGKYDTKWIKIRVFDSNHSRELVEKYVEQLTSRLKQPVEYRRGNYVEIIIIDDKVLIGYPVTQRRKFIDKRIYTRSIALPIDLARLLVNLTRVKEGEVLLDPFVGTGTILIEANLMNIFAIGIDIDYELVRVAKSNLSNYGLNKYLLIHGDSRNILFNNIDGIATNPPYGRGVSIHGRELVDLYENFINNAVASLEKNRYIVFVTSSYLEKTIDELINKYGLRLENKHYIYVHSSLTRVIYEVKYI